jgi:uncharacterized protein YegL
LPLVTFCEISVFKFQVSAFLRAFAPSLLKSGGTPAATQLENDASFVIVFPGQKRTFRLKTETSGAIMERKRQVNLLQTMIRGVCSPMEAEAGLKMKMRPWMAALALLTLALLGFSSRGFAQEDGIALAIIYDTSGSMREMVRDASGKSAPKYQIANRALMAVARQIQAFATNSAAGARTIHCGLFTFQGDSAKEAVPFGPFDIRALEGFARTFASPNGYTPLGNALNTAAKTVLNSPLSRKHVLIITDGVNTRGPRPEQVLPKVKEQASQKKGSISVHFVAFDVDARQFDAVKKLDATVAGAADEKQLNSQLQFILQQKILLEDEEPPKTK